MRKRDMTLMKVAMVFTTTLAIPFWHLASIVFTWSNDFWFIRELR